MKSWYAVRSKPHMELWARSNLWERDLEVYLPQYLKLVRHARRHKRVPRPLFPGYLFVRADLELGEHRAIGTAPGVLSIVSFGSRVPAVPDKVIAEISSRESEDGFIRLDEASSFKRGDELELHCGPFADHIGVFEMVSDEKRVVLLLSLLGRQVRVRVPADQVRRRH